MRTMRTCRLFNICRRQRKKYFVVLFFSILSMILVFQGARSKEKRSPIGTVSLPLSRAAQAIDDFTSTDDLYADFEAPNIIYTNYTNNSIITSSLITTISNQNVPYVNQKMLITPTSYPNAPEVDQKVLITPSYPNLSDVDHTALPSAKWLKTLRSICASESNKHPFGFSSNCSRPLLTMFTTMDVANMKRIQIHYNTIVNWGALGPCVQRILFADADSSPVVQYAVRHGWIVEKIPLKVFDIPVLKSMYFTAFKLSSTPLYLYANADILFDNGLIKTTLSLLCALKREANETDDNDYLQQSIFDKGIFAVGKRINVPLTKLKSVLPDALPVFRKTTRLFHEYAEDYFITTSGPLARIMNSTALTSSAVKHSTGMGHFPWEKVPDFVIGRPGYDNWLVAQALRWNVTLSIDLSRTVMAAHQTGVDGVHSGFTALRNWRTLKLNIRLAEGKKKFAFSQGVTGCMPWFSFQTRLQNVRFLTRSHRKEICSVHINITMKPIKLRDPKSNGAKAKTIVTVKNTSMPIKLYGATKGAPI